MQYVCRNPREKVEMTNYRNKSDRLINKRFTFFGSVDKHVNIVHI